MKAMTKLTVYWTASKALLLQELKDQGKIKSKRRMLEIEMQDLSIDQREALMALTDIRGSRGPYAGSIKPLMLNEIKWFDKDDGLWKKEWIIFDHVPSVDEVIVTAQRMRAAQQERLRYRKIGYKYLWQGREMFVRQNPEGLKTLLQTMEAEPRLYDQTGAVRHLLEYLQSGDDLSYIKDTYDLDWWYTPLAEELGVVEE